MRVARLSAPLPATSQIRPAAAESDQARPTCRQPSRSRPDLACPAAKAASAGPAKTGSRSTFRTRSPGAPAITSQPASAAA